MAAVTKIDFKRELRELYLPGREPSLVDVPEMAFLMVDGRGNPNIAASYREAIESLYTVAYTVRFAIKRMASGGVDYGVMPLESLWWSEGATTLNLQDKSAWNWTAMIMQPDPVTAEVVAEARVEAARKRSLPALELLRYERFAEGTAAQIMHVGPHSTEGPTIRVLDRFIAEHGCTPIGKHHEIYLGDPRRAAPEKLRTVIRQPVSAREP
jgi:hypothetical protein